MNFFIISSLCACVFGACAGGPAARLVDGQESEDPRQFPHHVVISPLRAGHKCGGSILNAHWVLTSAACVKERNVLNLYFGKINTKPSLDNSVGVTVRGDQMYVQDSLALIQLHKPIEFSDVIAPIKLSQLSAEELGNRFAVMPGFSERKLTSFSSEKLGYGMFAIQEPDECRRSIERNDFRDERQLCTRGWGGNVNSPCDSDRGSGLIVGWPARSEIVGVFAQSNCDASSPGIYIYLGRYLSWIEETIEDSSEDSEEE